MIRRDMDPFGDATRCLKRYGGFIGTGRPMTLPTTQMRKLLWFLHEHRRIRREVAALPPCQGMTVEDLRWRLERINELQGQANDLRSDVTLPTRAWINRLAGRLSRWAENLYPEHDWTQDAEGLLYCSVCWLPYSHWTGDLCPDEERVNARLPEWRPPNPRPRGVTR